MGVGINEIFLWGLKYLLREHFKAREGDSIALVGWFSQNLV